MEYYTAIEMNENLSSATTWTDLEVIMLSKISPLFDCLKSDPNPSSKKKLTSETESALVKVDEALNDQLIGINITRGLCAQPDL